MTVYHLKLDVDYEGVYSGAQVSDEKKPKQNSRAMHCGLCHKKLSSYHNAKYCFQCKAEGQKIEDAKYEEKRREQQLKSFNKKKGR